MAEARAVAPLFSVVLPTFNRKRFIMRTIQSVLGQSECDFELIVVDDGSSDDYLSNVRALRDMRLNVIRSSVNLGAARARNIGIGASRGRYVSFIDDDDEWRDSFLATTAARLEDTPAEVGMSWCGVECVTLDSPDARVVRSWDDYRTVPPDSAALQAAFLSIGVGFGLTVKRECLTATGLFNPNLKTIEDTDWLLRALLAGFVPVAVPGVHVTVHHHNQERMTNPANHAMRLRECEWLLVNYAAFFDMNPLARSALTDQIRRLHNGVGPIWSVV
jgi:glycosyltransferase involved in cell wall biosynthesis